MSVLLLTQRSNTESGTLVQRQLIKKVVFPVGKIFLRKFVCDKYFDITYVIMYVWVRGDMYDNHQGDGGQDETL